MRRDETILFGSDQPDDPDALVILDALARGSSRPMRWTAREEPVVSLLDPPARDRVTTASERSARSLIAYGRAPIVFHTSGLYTSPEPARGRTVVTVWHGDGPKATHPPAVRGTYMVAGVERFGRRRIVVHRYPAESLLVTGRPRVDDLFRGMDDGVDVRALEALGLDGRPIVWWLPTWRQDRRGRPIQMDAAASRAVALDGSLTRDYQFVVKPHRLSPPSAWPAGWRVITDTELRHNGVRLYRLLGRAHAVITDYSSIWSDFLGTQVPVAFVIDDVAQFSDARGFYESDWQDRLPGPVLADGDALARFVEAGWTEQLAARRQALADELGAANSPGATQRLLAALEERGVAWR